MISLIFALGCPGTYELKDFWFLPQQDHDRCDCDLATIWYPFLNEFMFICDTQIYISWQMAEKEKQAKSKNNNNNINNI